ncbi:outer membrane protein [Methylobacterium sp. E-045]|uniref:outer membrane protein n=1 Tax=Methylobacterium sp. E-045 TaxID=2836575 RepID=UPI001FBAC3E8|nr:outer membrane beta-barrel protein [Methylobacterium sp. E-045]MCJ2128191.1 outer membrane beta-barrel protein [Methylobacterium sp. E-045]
MKHLVVLGSLLAGSFAGAAQAADLPSTRYAPPVVTLPVFTWTGFYAGVNAGAAFSGSEQPRYTEGRGFVGLNPGVLDGLQKSREQTGFVGGGQIGYNYQVGGIVLGAEADFQYAGIERGRTGTGALTNLAPGHTDTDILTSRTRIETLGTVRGRIGFLPTERLMVYATGGLAYGDVSMRTAYTDTGTGPFFPGGINVIPYAASRSSMQVGYVAGGGIEYAITDRLSAKIEGLYGDLGRSSVTARYTGNGSTEPTDIYTVRESNRFGLVRAGLNYRFTGL